MHRAIRHLVTGDMFTVKKMKRSTSVVERIVRVRGSKEGNTGGNFPSRWCVDFLVCRRIEQ